MTLIDDESFVRQRHHGYRTEELPNVGDITGPLLESIDKTNPTLNSIPAKKFTISLAALKAHNAVAASVLEQAYSPDGKTDLELALQAYLQLLYPNDSLV